MSKKITFTSLRKFNLTMGFMHLVQGILLLVLSKSFTLPISGSYLAFNKDTLSLIPASKVLFDLSSFLTNPLINSTLSSNHQVA